MPNGDACRGPPQALTNCRVATSGYEPPRTATDRHGPPRVARADELTSTPTNLATDRPTGHPRAGCSRSNWCALHGPATNRPRALDECSVVCPRAPTSRHLEIRGWGHGTATNPRRAAHGPRCPTATSGHGPAESAPTNRHGLFTNPRRAGPSVLHEPGHALATGADESPTSRAKEPSRTQPRTSHGPGHGPLTGRATDRHEPGHGPATSHGHGPATSRATDRPRAATSISEHFRDCVVESGFFGCYVLTFCPTTYNTLIISA